MIFNAMIEKILPCIADSTKIRVVVSIDKDFSELFPYLKAILKKGFLLKNPPSYSYKKDGKCYSIYKDSILMTKLKDEEEVWRELSYISTLIEKVLNEKEMITPDFTTGKRVSVMDIYKYLPKTNCKTCGEASCFAFATKLSNEEKNIMECTELFQEKHKESRNLLLNLLLESGFDIPDIYLEG